MLSIIIPARTELYLNRTIQDVLAKATGEIEIIVVLDGYGDTPYEPVIDKRVKYISLPLPNNHERHKRQAVNAGVSISHGEYIMWMDAHCVIAPGFDEVLKRDCQENWVMVPSRYQMNLEKWDREEPTEDYRYWRWSCLSKENRLAQWRWGKRDIERKDILIDDIFATQGSLFFMTRKWFYKMGFMKTEGYMGWGQEGEEICLTTLFNGGRVVVDKNTWYAHLGKEQMKRRMHKWVSAEPCYDYSYDYWVRKKKYFFIDLINKNMPVPNYPKNWEEQLYGNS
jgi:glycosyltransferase involved in cell wall biosynthesis